MLMMENDNYDVNQNGIKVLVNAYKRNNKKRDFILISGVSIMVGLTFTVFSFLYGKLNTDILKNVREDGITVSTYLENGTKELEDIISRLSYVKKVGAETFAGKVFFNDQKIATCIVTDELTYQTMIKPAYTNVNGSYPRNVNEIMLSQKTLRFLGIDNPRIGMEINLEFYWNRLSKEKLTGFQTFILSGYYTDYQNSLSNQSIAYISDSRCKEGNIELYPSRILIDVNTKYAKGEQIEENLYQSIPLSDDGQYFVSSDTAQYRAMESIAGGFGSAIVFILLICFSMFIFVYNTLFISLNYDIRQYGLLEVIGVTGRQIKIIIYRQIIRIFITGCVLGGGIGGIAVYQYLPKLLNNMYLGNDINVREISAFNTCFFAITILLTAVTMLTAAKIVVNKMLKMSPVEAMKGVKQAGGEREGVTKKERNLNINPIFALAFGNIIRDKKKFALTVASLTIGCVIALGSCVLAVGTDSINKLSKSPDFEIGFTQEAINNLLENSDDLSEKRLLTEELISDLILECNLNQENLIKVYGYLPIYDGSAQNILGLLNEYRNHTIVIQKIDNPEWKNLMKYIMDKKLLIDTKRFDEGKGTIILHNHLSSKGNEKTQEGLIGKSILLYDIAPQGTKVSEISSIQLQNCGYLDISNTGFPDLNLSDNGADPIYFIVLEKEFNRLSKSLTIQLLKTEINVSKEKENSEKSLLKSWVKEKNLMYQTKNDLQNQNLMYLVCNSDVIAGQKKYIAGSRIIMMSICTALLFVGIINYSNTMVMNILTRNRELMILESIGLSRKGLRSMLILEGLLYSFTIIGILLTAGNLFLFLLVKYVQSKLTYFKFVYPFPALFLLGLLLVFMCILIPFVVYGRHIKGSISQRIKQIKE